ncbi:YkvA family protein [Streptomyces sp. A3M-1-3]|uniref:YkvA family protein n=1 Tax=Streptomyces sp. A3M-1-3 TaxID=2962044 RepID=UPI0020B7F770|nr:YkvA family protein [Streptomyces sp. A3M-1-3]MCP3819683.1 YkvA family protein [Streptomyces sp. A3M-1-3]
MSTELQVVVAIVVVLAVLTLGLVIALVVRMVRVRRELRRAGVPAGSRWAFWGALAYVVLPVDLLPDPVLLDDIGVLLIALRSLHATADREGAPLSPAPSPAASPGMELRARGSRVGSDRPRPPK